MNLMAAFTYNCLVLDRGTTFVFGSWVCVANGSGGFDSQLANPREPEAPPARRSDANKCFDDLGEMLLPKLAKQIEEKLVLNTSSTRSPINLRSETTRSKIHCVQPTFGLRNASSVY